MFCYYKRHVYSRKIFPVMTVNMMKMIRTGLPFHKFMSLKIKLEREHFLEPLAKYQNNSNINQINFRECVTTCQGANSCISLKYKDNQIEKRCSSRKVDKNMCFSRGMNRQCYCRYRWDFFVTLCSKSFQFWIFVQ